MPEFQSLADRLTKICKWEGVSTDLKTMMSLCEITQGDMRSSINTLQFLQKKTKQEMHNHIKSLQIGAKDISASWLKVAQTIFKKGAPSMKITDKMKSNEIKYVSSIVDLVSSHSDTEKIIQGIFN
jgi:chromosome transmission fidelity protein 18